MASSSSRPTQQEYAFSGASSSDRPAFSGIEPSHEKRRVSESSRLYEVFVNHRGPDVKNTLALQLYKSLKKVNIRAFLDSEEKEYGVSFTSTIENAIRSAAVHIAIFSKGYAESPWCLEELVLMLRSKAKIIPIFFDVEPSALRYVEKGVYGKAFSEYENKKRYMEKLEEWKKALQSVSFIAGEEFKSFSDWEKIISAVHKEVQRMRNLVVAKYPVGLPRLVEQFQSQCINEVVQDFESQCGISKQVKGKSKIVGIFGMGGVGKTTLSKEFFNRKHLDYTRSCFLFDVREASVKKDLPSLQMKLLRELFDEKDLPSFQSVEDGTSCLSNHFSRSGNLSYLIVLDDINHQEQLDALLLGDELNKFGKSLVIVTTRDVGVLINAGITVGYHLKEMDKDDAKELFCWHAFRQSYPFRGWEELVDPFVQICGGLPLSLQVLGRHVRGEDRRFWELELRKIKRTLPQDIQGRLRISIDTLDNKEKQIFIDIACFFIGELTADALSVWEASGWNSQHALRRLKNKCLVEEIDSDKYRGPVDSLYYHCSEECPTVLRMHDHLRDLGRQMADELKHPRRLWRSQHLQSLDSGRQMADELNHPRRQWRSQHRNLVYHRLRDLGREMADKLSHPRRMRCSPPQSSELKEFEKIVTQPRLRCLLYLKTGGTSIKCFLGESKNVAETSTALLWHELSHFGDTLKTIPPWIPLQNLRSLRIDGGSLERYWQNNERIPFALKELQILNASELEDLGLGYLTCLEKITIHNCPKLETTAAISHLRELAELNISSCQKLKELSLKLHPYLEKVRIFNCWSLRGVTVSNLEKLIELNIKTCGIEKLNLVQLNCLEKLKISDCPDLWSVAGMSDLRKLVEFQIARSSSPQEISFSQLNCLEKITISRCPQVKSVSAMSNLRKLVELHVDTCSKLVEIKFSQVDCLEQIRISDCPRLMIVAGISDLRK